MNNDRIATIRERYEKLSKNPNPMFSTGEKYYLEDVPNLLSEIDRLTAELASCQQIKKSLSEAGYEDLDAVLRELQQVKSALSASQRREQAAVEAIPHTCETCEHKPKNCPIDNPEPYMKKRRKDCVAWTWCGPQEGGE